LDFIEGELLVKLQFQDFLAANDSEGQSQCEDQAGFGVKSLSNVIGEGRPAEHAFETAHQVVMADQAQIAAFAESYTDLVTNHAEKRRGGGGRETRFA
jgi:hypothetical protein